MNFSLKKILLTVIGILGIPIFVMASMGLSGGGGMGISSDWWKWNASGSVITLNDEDIGDSSNRIDAYFENLDVTTGDFGTLKTDDLEAITLKVTGSIDPGPLTISGSSPSTFYGDGTTATLGGGLEVKGNIHLNDNYISNDGDNEGIRIDDDGKVGINTNSPGEELEVYKTSESEVFINTSNAGDAKLSFGETGTKAYILAYDGGDNKLYHSTSALVNFYSVDRDTGAISHPLTGLTSGIGLSMQSFDSLTGGSIAKFESDSSDVNIRTLVEIHNNNASSTGTIPLKVTNDSSGQPAIKAVGRIEATAPSFYEEMWNGLEGAWATRITTGSQAAQSRNNGWRRFTTGATATNEESIDFNDIVTCQNILRPTFEARIDLEQITNLEVDIGLIESSGVGADDYILFKFDSSSANTWKLETSNGGSTSSNAGAIATTNAIILKFEFTSDTAVRWYINDSYQGSVSTDIPAVALQPVIAIRTEENAAHFLEVDFVKLWQDRD